MTAKRLRTENGVVLLVLFGSPVVLAIIDLLVGYPLLPWWQRFPHNLGEAAMGAAVWWAVMRSRS